MKKYNERQGFTLIEILVVIGIIAILAAIVVIAINPARQFAQARNSQRLSNINTYLNAIGQDMADNKGLFGGVCASVSLPATTTAILNGSGTGVNLSCLTPTYIPAGLPTDPTYTSGTDTFYTVVQDNVGSTTGRVTVCAPKSVETALGSPVTLCVVR